MNDFDVTQNTGDSRAFKAKSVLRNACQVLYREDVLELSLHILDLRFRFPWNTKTSITVAVAIELK